MRKPFDPNLCIIGLVFVLLSLCIQNLPADATTNELTGILHSGWVDPLPESGIAPHKIYFLADQSGESNWLSFDDAFLLNNPDFESLIGREVLVEVDHNPADSRLESDAIDNFLVSSIQAISETDDTVIFNSPSQTEGTGVPQSQKWITLLCKFPDIEEEPKSADFFRQMYGDETDGLNRFWREVSGERINLDGSVVYDWVELPEPSEVYVNPWRITKMFWDCTAAVDDFVDFSDDVYGLNLMFNAGLGSYRGAGLTHFHTLDGVYKAWPVTWLRATGDVDEGILAHEMGHTYKLPHADNGDGDANEYDNPWDVMSLVEGYAQQHPERGYLGKHLNAFHKLKLDWFDEDEVFDVGEKLVQQVQLDATYNFDTSNHRAIVIPEYGSANYYIVEVRKRLGEYDGYLPGDAVIIHYVDYYRYVLAFEPGSSLIDIAEPPAQNGDGEGSMFRVGETYASPTGVFSIRVDAETVEGFIVTVDTTGLDFNQSCSEENIVLETQQQIDNFDEIYGPCDTVTGSLSIDPSGMDPNDIVNLLGLSNLEYVHHWLGISNTQALESLDGLNNLTRTHQVRLRDNEVLADTQALSSLNKLWVLDVRDNGALRTLGGLEQLQEVGGDIRVTDNPILTDCSVLSALIDRSDDFEKGPGPANASRIPDVGNIVTIEANAPGCNSIEEIAPTPSVASALVGSWYDPGRAGTGFMWHAVDDELAIGYYYGFDNDGERFWMIGVHEGPMEWEQQIEFESVYVTGGDFNNFQPELISEHTWGVMNVDLESCERGHVELFGEFPGTSTSQGVLTGVIRLAPMAGFKCFGSYPEQATDGLTGSWFDPLTSGQGFAVHKVDEDTGVIYYYGFDAAGKPLWLIGVWEESLGFGSEIELQMNQVTGGAFEFFDPDQIQETPWGSLRIRFDNCNTAWAELSGDDGMQHFDLSLLAGSAGIECVGPD